MTTLSPRAGSPTSTRAVALLLLLLLANCPPHAAAHQARQKRLSVHDYYLRLPAKYVSFYEFGDDRAAREALIKTEDVANGYLELGSRYDDASVAVALFRGPGGDALVAVASEACSPMCEGAFYLLRYDERAGWRDVTAAELPRIDVSAARARVEREAKRDGLGPDWDFDLLYKLPRRGTTVLVRDNYARRAVCELRWTRGKFVVKYPAR